MPDQISLTPVPSETPTGESVVQSPTGLYALTWTSDTSFYLLRNGDSGPRVEVEGLASDEGRAAAITSAAVTDLGSFALAVCLGAGENDEQTVFFVAGPDGYRRMRGRWTARAGALGLSPSGSWFAIQALPDAAAPESGLLHLFNTAEGKLLWAVRPATGNEASGYRFDELGGLLYVQVAGGEFPYHLPDGRFESLTPFRRQLIANGTPSQLREFALREFETVASGQNLGAARRRAAAKSIFELLTLAAQRGPDWAPAFHALGEFFDWLPDPTKAARCHARAQELRASPPN